MGKIRQTPTGIAGLDELLHGGLPTGRPTLVYGGPGCGKTMLSVEFLCRNAHRRGGRGLFLSLDETREDLIENFADCGFDLPRALESGAVRIKYLPVGDLYLTHAGEFTLDAFLVNLERWVDETRADMLVLDSIDALFANFPDNPNFRSELTRVIRWTSKKGLTIILTSEQHRRKDDPPGVEEYLADCSIMLDHRVKNQIAKRRLRVVKFRGVGHGTDEYPFIITGEGLRVFPITSVGLDGVAAKDFISSGVKGLDAMLADRGHYRDSTILVTGEAGAGKTTLAAGLAHSVCLHGGRCLFLSFEESTSQLVRDLAPIGLDLEPMIDNDSLRFEPVRPSLFGLEEHLVRIHNLVEEIKPDAVVIDPITNFVSVGSSTEIKALFTRLIDFIKNKGITLLMTSLDQGEEGGIRSQTEISSVVDTWIVLHYRRIAGLRRKLIYIHKARGVAHSQEVGEYVITEQGPMVRPFSNGTGLEADN